MKIRICMLPFLWMLLPGAAFCQGKQIKSIIPDSVVIQKWTRACINFEAKPNFFISKNWVKMYRQSISKQGIDSAEAFRIQDSAYHRRFTGTAIYFVYRNKHYLITARHVLEDTSSYFSPDVFSTLYLVENGSHIINGIPINSFRYYMMLTLRRPVNEVPIILSDKVLDLAIISLENVIPDGKQFINALGAYSYVPITINDIDTTDNVKPDDKIFAFGFPQFSEVARMELPKNIFGKEYIKVTVPVLTKGYIEKESPKGSVNFTGNIFIYYGFSGGACVRNNKLIGINDAYFPGIYKMNIPQLNYFIKEEAVFSKSKYILPMIRELERRLSTK